MDEIRNLLAIVKEYNGVGIEEYRLAQGERNEIRDLLGMNVEGSPCADGRNWLNECFGFPVGVISEYPSIGAILDPGWTPVRNNLYRTWKWCLDQTPKRRNLFLATYHYSSGGHGNCAGHGDDIEASIRSAWEFRRKYAECFPAKFSMAGVWGFDTDNDLATIHSYDDPAATLKIADYLERPDNELASDVKALFPSTHPQIVNGIAVLAQYNLAHAREIINNPRTPDEVGHNENGIVVGVGSGVSIAPRDLMLRVGCYSPHMVEPLQKAASVIATNRRRHKTPPGQNPLLLATGTFFDSSGPDALLAKQEARSLANMAKEIVLEAEPKLAKVLEIALGIVHHHDRSLEIFETYSAIA